VHETDDGLSFAWSPVYRPEWDDVPDRYVEHDVVAWGRSRRLARIEDPSLRLKAYLGVQHFDPARWNLPGEARTVFFLSLFVGGRTVTLRTYPSFAAVLAALRAFHAELRETCREC
jgi:hypothetical protein